MIKFFNARNTNKPSNRKFFELVEIFKFSVCLEFFFKIKLIISREVPGSNSGIFKILFRPTLDRLTLFFLSKMDEKAPMG